MNKRQSRQKMYAKLINSRQKSKLSISDFCLQNNVSVPTYYYWQRKFKKITTKPGSNSKKDPEFIACSSRFVPVRINPSYSQNNILTDSSSVSIDLPSNVTITFRGSAVFAHSIGKAILSNIKMI